MHRSQQNKEGLSLKYRQQKAMAEMS